MITLTACGSIVDQGKPIQKSAGLAICEFVDEHERKCGQVILEPFGSCTKNQADLRATLLALHSVKSRFRKLNKVAILVPPYVCKMLEKSDNSYKSEPKKNKEDIDNVRKVFDTYTNIELQTLPKEDNRYSEELTACTMDQRPSRITMEFD